MALGAARETMKRSAWGRALALTLFLSLITWQVVAAHAFLSRSDPEDGAVLDEFPREVRLWFSEPVALEFTSAELVNSDGQALPITSLTLDSADPTLVIVALAPQPPNAYRLTWQTLSTDDVHPSNGALVFGVQQSAASVAALTTPPPPPGEVFWRWLDFSGLAGLLGALGLMLFVLPPSKNSNQAHADLYQVARTKLLWLALGGGVVALLAGAGLVWTQGQAVSGSGSIETILQNVFRLINGTAYGARWWQRQGLLSELSITVSLMRHFISPASRSQRLNPRSLAFLVIALPAFLWVLTQALSPYAAGGADRASMPMMLNGLNLLVATLWSGGIVALALVIAPAWGLNSRAMEFLLVAPFALLLVMTQAWNSHAAGVEDRVWVSVALDTLHLLAATLWSGGVVALTFVIAPVLSRPVEVSAWAWEVLRRFGKLAAACVAVLTVTGLYNLGQQVASLDALLVTSYGQTLVVKILWMFGAGLLGLLNAALLHPRLADSLRRVLRQPAGWQPLAPQHLWRTLSAEAMGLSGLLLITAFLGATTPARGPEFAPSAVETAPATFTANADDLLVTLSIKPNRPGQNFITMGVFNTRRPAPAPIEQVLVELQPPGQTSVSLVAEAQGNDQYQIVGNVINAAGEWPITLTVQRPNLPEAQVTTRWRVRPVLVSARRPVWISNQPLSPWLNWLAGGLAFLLSGLAVWFGRAYWR